MRRGRRRARACGQRPARWPDLRNGGPVPPQVPLPAHLKGRPFKVAEALAAGLSAETLRSGRFCRIRRGVYAESDVPDDLGRKVDAARLVLPAEAVVSHHTAAQLRGLPVPSSPLVHVTLPPDVDRTKASGLRSHEAAVVAVEIDGRPLTTPTENFLELAEFLSLVDLVVLGDAMVRRRLTTCAQLQHAVATTTRRRGIRTARRAVGLVRPRVDSPQETRLRLLIVLAGLPEPVPNFLVRDDLGGWIGEVDLAYAGWKIAIEYHGDVHRARERWRSDITKAELLRELGWTVIILTGSDLEDRPERCLNRIRSALEAAGHPGLPAVLDPRWRAHLMPAWARERLDWAGENA